MAESNEISKLKETINKIVKDILIPKINDNNRSIGKIIKTLDNMGNRITKIEKNINNRVEHKIDDERRTEQGIREEYNKRLEEVEKWLEDLHQKYIEEKKKRLELEEELNIIKSAGKNKETKTKENINISNQEYEKKLNKIKNKTTNNTNSKFQYVSKDKVELKIDVVPDKNHEDLIRKQDASEMFYIYKLRRQNDYFLTLKEDVLNSLNINDYLFIKEIKKFFNLSGNQGSRFKIVRDAKIDNWNGTSGKVISKGDIVYS